MLPIIEKPCKLHTDNAKARIKLRLLQPCSCSTNYSGTILLSNIILHECLPCEIITNPVSPITWRNTFGGHYGFHCNVKIGNLFFHEKSKLGHDGFGAGKVARSVKMVWKSRGLLAGNIGSLEIQH